MMAAKRGRPRRVWYRRLRERMHALGVTAADLGQVLRLDGSTVCRKLNGSSTWALDEAYSVLSALKIPPEQFYLFFPHNGEDVEEIRHHYVSEYLEETNQALVPKATLNTLVTLVGGMAEGAAPARRV